MQNSELLDDPDGDRAARARDKRQRDRAEAQGRRLSAFLEAVLSTPQGREWLWEQLRTAHIFDNVFSPDPYITYFRLGEQNWGKQLFAHITSSFPEHYGMMAREAKERDEDVGSPE